MRAARLLRMLAVAYGVLCLLALLLIPWGLRGWFGAERTPFAAVFALFLSLPWSALARHLPDNRPLPALLVMVAGMGLNVLAPLLLAGWLARKAAAGGKR